MRTERFKSIRELRGLSQQDLSDRSGVSLRQIGRYESGQSDPTSDAIARIAQVLEVSVDYLVGLVNEPTEHFREDDLSPMERKLIWAVRHGMIVEAYKTVTTVFEESDQSNITPD